MSDINNRDIIDEYFLWYSDNLGLSLETQKGAKGILMQFLEVYGNKDLLAIDKADVTRYLNFVKTFKYTPMNKKDKVPKPYSPYTQFHKRSVVRGLLKWLHTHEDYHITNLAHLIRLKKVKQDNIKHELLTYQDAQNLVEVCGNQRDRAIVSFLIDGGVCMGELLRIKYSDVKFEKQGVIVFVPRGKTVPRMVFCYWCAQELLHWYHQHPLKTPDSFFFCSNRPPHGQFSKTGLASQLKRIAQKAGITQNIHPHLFRHSSATIYAAVEGMTDQKLKYRFGWTPGSSMADVYVKLSGIKSDDDILKAHGQPVSTKKVAGRDVIVCPNCKLANYLDADNCFNCMKPLSEKAIAEDNAIKEAAERAKIEELKEQLREEIKNAVQTEVKKSKMSERFELYDAIEEQKRKDRRSSKR